MRNFDDVALYGTEGCHLCEVAAQQIRELLCEFPGRQIAYVDIIDSDDLVARYAERIPLLIDEKTGEELGWPFTVEDIRRWLLS